MQFVGAKVMAVSAVPCWGRAVVLLVSMSPCFCVLCAKFVALRAHNGQKLVFDGALGQYFRGNAAEEAVPGEFVVPCTWQPAHLLAVLTLQCAAKPHWWHGGQPAQDTTYRVNGLFAFKGVGGGGIPRSGGGSVGGSFGG